MLIRFGCWGHWVAAQACRACRACLASAASAAKKTFICPRTLCLESSAKVHRDCGWLGGDGADEAVEFLRKRAELDVARRCEIWPFVLGFGVHILILAGFAGFWPKRKTACARGVRWCCCVLAVFVGEGGICCGGPNSF